MEETISIKEIAQVIRKRIGMIIVLTLGAALISGVVTFFMITPIYQSSSQFLVNQNNPQSDRAVELNDIRTNVEIINTYNEIIKSNRILDQVVQELDLTISSGTLSGKISVSNANNSQVVTVTATDPDPAMAVLLANTVVEVFQDQIDDLMNVDNVNILNEAQLAASPSPVSPNLTLNIAIALVLGAMVGVGLAFLIEFLDNTVKTEDDVEKTLGLPVIGVISHISDRELTTVKNQNVTHVARERGGFSGKAAKRTS
ncbi:Capsular polysaccharide biosynthesis protein [Amphibacillus marinus]|uniref:Capsular polysaccharide biosynthesis protein n=1 Tax=Amphibacillus marinus TaxID=872970 RepID=A0A1H8N5T9_9BACI|nr:Wzz/FepE/Etk N-terminal domain-containing protein [Amphibacillus marinus]SEO24977.1 Capsular polysaccharide biosynthesis protein [Amphibacillus marinus]